MVKSADPHVYIELVRHARAFLMGVLAEDAIALRPNRPRARGPLTPLAEKVYRTLIFHFENVLTGLCFPSIATLAKTAGCADNSVKRFLPALYEAEYLIWRKGKRKRIRTRAGWRVVRDSNRYRILCPRRYLAALRRALLKATGGRYGHVVAAVVARFTPPSEEAKEAAKVIETLAQDLRPSPNRAAPPPAPTQDTDPPSQGPPVPQGSVEMAGVQVEDPALGSVLARLWAGLEQRERSER